jgi:hypothetical protein
MPAAQDPLERDLRERGARAEAEIRAAQKTTNVVMEDGNTWFVWKLKLRVHAAGESDFDVDVRQRYPFGDAPTVGSKVTVLYDPDDHSATYVDGGPGDSCVEGGLAASRVDGGLGAAATRQLAERLSADLGAIEKHRISTERIDNLTRAADLHEQGVLTDAEFEKLKRKILES